METRWLWVLGVMERVRVCFCMKEFKLLANGSLLTPLRYSRRGGLRGTSHTLLRRGA